MTTTTKQTTTTKNQKTAPARRTPEEILAAILQLSQDLSEDLGDRYARSRVGQAVQDIKDRINGKDF